MHKCYIYTDRYKAWLLHFNTLGNSLIHTLYPNSIGTQFDRHNTIAVSCDGTWPPCSGSTAPLVKLSDSGSTAVATSAGDLTSHIRRCAAVNGSAQSINHRASITCMLMRPATCLAACTLSVQYGTRLQTICIRLHMRLYTTIHRNSYSYCTYYIVPGIRMTR